jgi:hypothetical protein
MAWLGLDDARGWRMTNLLASARSSNASEKSKSAHRPKHCTKAPLFAGMGNPMTQCRSYQVRQLPNRNLPARVGSVATAQPERTCIKLREQPTPARFWKLPISLNASRRSDPSGSRCAALPISSPAIVRCPATCQPGIFLRIGSMSSPRSCEWVKCGLGRDLIARRVRGESKCK